MATPLQIAGLINTIASGGVYREPYLVKGTVDSSKTFLEQNEPDNGTRVFSEETASLLRQYMGASVSYGTGKKGKPTLFLACLLYTSHAESDFVCHMGNEKGTCPFMAGLFR